MVDIGTLLDNLCSYVSLIIKRQLVRSFLPPAEMSQRRWREKVRQRQRKRRGGTMEERVRAVLDEIRPFLNADGGDAELVEVSSEGIVRIRLVGACGHCPMSTMTLKMGIEKKLKERVPEVKEVVAV
jgi:Fe-S cluster biogenesis protein NfuA